MRILPPPLGLDLTGHNPDNRVLGEPHTIGDKKATAIVPRLGLFYKSSFTMRTIDGLLVEGVDYKFEGLHQDLTIKTGKEVVAACIVSGHNHKDVVITYQAVGGHYTIDTDAIYGAYESVLKDTRPQEWQHIQDKPDQFNPKYHKHHLRDIYGWEPIIYPLERIAQAITLGNIDIVSKAVKVLLDKFQCGELDKILPTDYVLQHDNFLYIMTSRKIFSDISVKVVNCGWRQGGMATAVVDTSDIPVGTKVYWRFYKMHNAEIFTPIAKSGIVLGNGGLQYIHFYVPDPHHHVKERLYLGVTTQLLSDEFEAVTHKLNIVSARPSETTYGYMVGGKGLDTDLATIPSFRDDGQVTRMLYYQDHYCSMFSNL